MDTRKQEAQTVIELQLPWPPTTLNPNARMHWAALAREKALYRHACKLITGNQIKGEDVSNASGLHIYLQFVPPNKRAYDRDNLIARMKSGLDGMCDSLGIDDGKFSSISASLAHDTVGGYVIVRICCGDLYTGQRPLPS